MAKFKVINNKIRVNKDITKLDKFALEVIEIIKKYTDYVIISGYVSIFFGRSRATEDIDMFIKEMPYSKFLKMYKDFTEKGFEFTIDDSKKLYEDYLMKDEAINVWRKDFPLLRMEIKLANSQVKKLIINNPIKVYFKNKEILVCSIESQIAYKRYISKSEKDLEDARHLEIVFDLDKEKIKYFKDLFNKDEN